MIDRGSSGTADAAPVVTTADVGRAVGGRLHGSGEVALSGVTHDSSRVRHGWLFCAVVGAHHDGAEFAEAAVRAGAAAVLTERVLDLDVPQIIVEDARSAMAAAARSVHGDPASQLTMVGVTGTNGKTTVVSLLAHVLESAGIPTAAIGTLSSARTTPEATDLAERLEGFLAEGITHVVMEVSSHALAMHRVDGIVFEVAVFTNLGRDHLDFHGTQESYFAAKARLFDVDRCELAVLNADSVHGRLLADTVEVPVQTYGLAQVMELRLGRLASTGSPGAEFTWRGRHVGLPLVGRHNVSNALAAAESARVLGVPDERIVRALGAVPTVPGRFEVLDARPGRPTVVVDYAHTPDALENVLTAASEMREPAGELVVVFGCGGDRDRDKRAEMGAAATAGADVVVLTTDNPRSEDPMGIISEVLAGCDDAVVVEPDRRDAISRALHGRTEADVVMIAGKGHEMGLEFADHTEDFEDRSVAAELLDAPDGSP